MGPKFGFDTEVEVRIVLGVNIQIRYRSRGRRSSRGKIWARVDEMIHSFIQFVENEFKI